jgi:hypothetical protein
MGVRAIAVDGEAEKGKLYRGLRAEDFTNFTTCIERPCKDVGDYQVSLPFLFLDIYPTQLSIIHPHSRIQ